MNSKQSCGPITPAEQAESYMPETLVKHSINSVKALKAYRCIKQTQCASGLIISTQQWINRCVYLLTGEMDRRQHDHWLVTPDRWHTHAHNWPFLRFSWTNAVFHKIGTAMHVCYNSSLCGTISIKVILSCSTDNWLDHKIFLLSLIF